MTEFVEVRMLKDCPVFTGTDLDEYGPYEEGDVVEVPKDNADILTNRDFAEIPDAKEKSNGEGEFDG